MSVVMIGKGNKEGREKTMNESDNESDGGAADNDDDMRPRC